MRLLLLIPVLLLGCTKSPYGPFDRGHPVHVILTADPQPRKGLAIDATCTLGPQSARGPKRVLGRKGDRAVEVATFTAPKGKHRLAIWEARTKTDARAEIEVEREVWVVLTLRPKDPEGKLKVYDEPPGADLGRWRPLVALPD